MILLDTSVIFALLEPADSQHEKAKNIFDSFDWRKATLLEPVYWEILTVLKLKSANPIRQLATLKQFFDLVDITPEAPSQRATSETIKEMMSTAQKFSFVDQLLAYYALYEGAEVITFDRSLKNWISDLS